ncbi:hypothetical protein MSG28_012054 [Choristoneura fumiferana]|uniref:Uncharacterized protein n=1 Tax=Choristoneura fumiferana TaxID=7141 RepID=A0ACC0KP57_CHOFU|nr:hypothetical protein MSG28_012054 [Choristoneura fumiferana]
MGKSSSHAFINPLTPGFSQGSGLRTIAVGSANQAKTALGNQNAAGHQAAYVILSGLEQQVRDAKVALQAALNAAQATSENANEAASQAAGELGAQTAMVGAARQRLGSLQEQLHGVRIDFEATQAAARKAQAAAAGLSANQKPAHDASHEEVAEEPAEEEEEEDCEE